MSPVPAVNVPLWRISSRQTERPLVLNDSNRAQAHRQDFNFIVTSLVAIDQRKVRSLEWCTFPQRQGGRSAVHGRKVKRDRVARLERPSQNVIRRTLSVEIRHVHSSVTRVQ